MQLVDFTPRLYQETIFATVSGHNTLVVLPTGLGKTALAMMLVAHRLSQYPQSKCLILAPTRPLVDQHARTLRKHLPLQEEDIVVFTGHVSPKKRQEKWKSAKVIISTPQGLENDIIGNKIDITHVSALIVDEAHRAVGDYSYVWVTQQYQKRSRFPRVLALTASPGSDMEKIQEVIVNLGVEQIEVRVDTDPDVAPYVQEVDIVWDYVNLPEDFLSVQKYLKQSFASKIDDIKKQGVIDSNMNLSDSKRDLLRLQGHLQGEIAQGNRDFGVLRCLSLAAEAMKVQHAIELLETQGLRPLHQYFEQIQKQSYTSKVKAVQNLVRDLNFRSAFIKTQGLLEKEAKHPKIGRLQELLHDKFSSAGDDYKIILFTQYRDSGKHLMDIVNSMEVGGKKLRACLFVGQAKKRGSGLSQKEQLAMLQDFREGKFNVLVSSSVGEEGLDIPQVDMVLFYEPIPSAIRYIQRKGRTGRHGKGEVIILVSKGTRDEGYRWSAHHKEKRMYRTLDKLKKNMSLRKPAVKERTLQSFVKQEPQCTIIVDHREKGSPTIKELIDIGAHIDLRTLAVGDYVLSKRCAVEFKAVPDFVDSLIDGRLLQQAKELRDQYGRCLFVIEGMQDMFSVRNIHPNAIRGMLAALTVDFGIPVLQTKSSKETAALLMQIAKREQQGTTGGVSLHGDRKPVSLKEQQEYIITAFPGVGPSLAKPLLKKFGSIKNFVLASSDKLKEVPLLGEKKASQIKQAIDSEWKEFD